MSKKIYILIIFIINIPIVFSQNSFLADEIDLTNERPSIISVLGGNIICQPVRTSYGFVASGSSRQIYGWTQDGKLLWQRLAPGKLKSFITKGPEDLIYGVTTDSKIFMMNTTGLVLWQHKNSFEILDAPILGKDGRIYARGIKNISCYGFNGTCRWTIETEQQVSNLSLAELEDGSILAFLARTQDGKSIAKRYSPFGKEIEEIVFSGIVTNARTCASGVLLSFSNGTVGLCSIKENKTLNTKETVSKWIYKDNYNSTNILSYKGKAVFIYNDKVVLFEESNGKKLFEFQSKTSNLIYCIWTAQGLVCCTKTSAICYDEKGKILWQTKFAPQKDYDFVFPSDSGFLFFAMKNWVLEGYQMRLNLSSSSSWTEKEIMPYEYKDTNLKSSQFYGKIINDNLYNQIKSGFKNGNFGESEEEWNSLIFNELNRIYEELKSENANKNEYFYKKNIQYCQQIFELQALSGIYFGKTATFIKNIDDPSLLREIIHCAGEIGFDRDGEILTAFQYILRKNSISNRKLLLKEIADSTYKICKFMGKPTFFNQGKEVLNYMLSPQFDKETKIYALKTLDKLKEIDI